MSQQRPRRKATANKNYADTGSESLFDAATNSSSNSSKGSSSNSASGSGVQKSPRKRAQAANGKADVPAVNPANNGRKVGSTATPDSTQIVPYNWQPPISYADEFSHKLDLTDATVNTVLQTLSCPRLAPLMPILREESEMKLLQSLLVKNSGQSPDPIGSRRKQPRTCFQIKKGDYIYMISEPPGEPYYIGRVKGFKRKDEKPAENEIESASEYMFEIQWFYRPRDISKHTLDSRLLFASMHSDTCPLSSFRGLLTVLHKSDVDTYFQPPKVPNAQWSSPLEFYSSFPNCFYFDKLYDRYILKFYDVVKTSTLLPYIDNVANCSRNFILALNKRFEFVSMEGTRTKSFLNNFTSTSSTHCDVCAEWCGSSDSVTCAECDKHFHMLCLDPPLLKKPSRGFSWSCALCTKKHELEHQSKKMLMLSHDNRSTNEEELSALSDPVAPQTEADQHNKKRPDNSLPKYEQMAIEYLSKDAIVSALERRLKEEWNIRYLGTNARLEEAVDPYDRSYYPRVSTSLGQRYQATSIPEFENHPIVYYDPEKSQADKNKKKSSGAKRPTKKKAEPDTLKELPIPKEYQGVPTRDYPQWLQPRPKGYIERGVDDGMGETCTLMWKPSEKDLADDFRTFDAYVAAQDHIATKLGLHPNSPNFADAVAKAYIEFDGQTQKASEEVSRLTRASLHEPTFNKEEVKRFEAGVKKHGSELYPTSKEVKTQPMAMIVRFYYIWKKTPRGHAIWGNFPGRKKKPSKESEMKIRTVVDDYADSDDDSAYENEKIVVKRRPFQCKHCRSYISQKWFKITGFDGTTTHIDTSENEDIDPLCVIALCFRCAKIWRRYAVYWEDPMEVDKKNAKGAGGYRKKVEAELVMDAQRILLQAQTEGVALSYDIGRVHPVSSVMNIYYHPIHSNGDQKPPTQIANTSRMSEEINSSDGKAALKAPSSTKGSTRVKKPTDTDIDQAKKPHKASVKKSSDNGADQSATKKRKVDSKPIPEATKSDRSKKRQAPVKAETNGTAKKKKPSPSAKQIPKASVKKEDGEVLISPKAVKNPEPKIDAKATSVKRQRKNADTTALMNPLFNIKFKEKVEELVAFSKSDKRSSVPLNKENLEEAINVFKYRQLLDMKLPIQGWQALHQAKIDLPFAVNDRNCSVCLEHDKLDSSSHETLICSNCGVNVHGSCAGIIVSGKTKPVRQWLCDPCVNDMGPKFSTDYSCSICLAKSANQESVILGNPSERPDYLVPILETGRWCHMICALYCHTQIAFRQVAAPSFVAKDVLNSTSTKSIGYMVESASRIFVENFDKRCGICNCFNGGLISCDMCETKGNVFHVTCAQDTPNFKLGFKLVPQKMNKGSTNTIVRDQIGKLEPILICPDHDQKGNILDLRDQGKRSSTGELRPLIQLFIEDLMKQGLRSSGPQLRAHNYISMISAIMEKADRGSGKLTISEETSAQACHFCKISSSPKWWPLNSVDAQIDHAKPENLNGPSELGIGDNYFSDKRPDDGFPQRLFSCQRCHVLGPDQDIQDAEPEGDKLISELSKPLCGDRYGIVDSNDHLKYSPLQHKQLPVERSEITLGDLLA